jgi:GAF domain-containing protein
MLMTVMVMMLRIAGMLLVAVEVSVSFLAVKMIARLVITVMRQVGLDLVRAGRLDDAALDAVAIAAAARIAVARAAAVGTVFGLFFSFAMGAFVRLDQRLAIGDRDLIIVRMDFAEGQKAVAVAAIFNEGGLQGGLYARDLGEIDIPTQLFALGGLEIKLFDSIAADHNDPGLFRVGGIDQHFVGHFGTLGGGGRVSRLARMARPGDATVHLIRG